MAFIFTDLHGNLVLYNKIKYFIKQKEEKEVYFLGDAMDRMPNGVTIARDIIANPNITYLKGNHEDLMFNALNPQHWDREDYTLWVYNNGGVCTKPEFDELTKEEQEEFLHNIRRLPLEAKTINSHGETFLLNHSGFNTDLFTGIDVDTERRITGGDPILWDRYYILNSIGYPNRIPENLNKFKESKTYIVHGHTPTCALKKVNCEGKIYQYYEGNKIDLDLGSFYTHLTCIFDTETFNVYYFDESDNFEPCRIERAKRYEEYGIRETE